MQLYDELMALATDDDVLFYANDQITPVGTKVKVFSYHMASYSDWLRPGALECRGIMFEMDGDKPVRIMSRPMEKFFNLGENPMTMNLDFSQIDYLMTKADGSLISTFLDKGFLYTKSKTSMYSSQALAANAIINDPANVRLHDKLVEIASEGFTVNMEYCAPDNRIVLPYQEPQLIILNVRNNETGEYLPYDTLFSIPVLRPYLVQKFTTDNGQDDEWTKEQAELWVQTIRDMTDIEGYVVRMKDGLHFKLKTDWYVALHRTKDTITSNKDLFAAVVNAASDDLRSLFEGDEYSLAKIEAFEDVYAETFKRQFNLITKTYEKLRFMDRREFAIQGQADLANDRELFSILMKLYQVGMNHDVITNGINDMFLKYVDRHIPANYR